VIESTFLDGKVGLPGEVIERGVEPLKRATVVRGLRRG
jgi:hypothetical protein